MLKDSLRWLTVRQRNEFFDFKQQYTPATLTSVAEAVKLAF